MSIVCAAIKNGVVAISGDTQTSYGSLNVSATHMKNSGKLYGVKRSIIGVVGWRAMTDVLEHLMINEKELFQLDNRMDIFSTLLQLQQKMKDEYFIDTTEDGDQPVEFNQLTAMIVNNHGIFQIGSYREVNQYNTCWAIGSGKRLGLGAMHALYSTNVSAKRIVEAGVRAAAEYDDSCSLPLNTRTVKLVR